MALLRLEAMRWVRNIESIKSGKGTPTSRFPNHFRRIFPTQAIAASYWVVSRVSKLARFGSLPFARGHILVGINGSFFLGSKGRRRYGYSENRVIRETQ